MASSMGVDYSLVGGAIDSMEAPTRIGLGTNLRSKERMSPEREFIINNITVRAQRVTLGSQLADNN